MTRLHEPRLSTHFSNNPGHLGFKEIRGGIVRIRRITGLEGYH